MEIQINPLIVELENKGVILIRQYPSGLYKLYCEDKPDEHLLLSNTIWMEGQNKTISIPIINNSEFLQTSDVMKIFNEYQEKLINQLYQSTMPFIDYEIKD